VISTRLKAGRSTWALLAALALVVLWTHSMDSKVKQMRARAAAAAAAAPGVGANPAAQAGVPALVTPAPAALASVRVAPWGEDPFWKSAADATPRHGGRHRSAWKPSGAGLRLTGILWSGTEAGSSATICDQTVRVGETAYRWKVLRITANSVTLEDRGAVVTLKLNEDEP
jgi:hypothetical protein